MAKKFSTLRAKMSPEAQAQAAGRAEETLYLLSSANNAKRLRESIAQLKAGKAQVRKLLDNEQTEERK